MPKPVALDASKFDPDLELFKACVAGDPLAVAAALAAGADPSKPERSSKMPPLAWVVRLGQGSCVEPLLAAGAQAWNYEKGEVKSAVGYAIEFERWDILAKIVGDRRAPRPNAHQLDGLFMQAVALGQTQALPHLVSAGYSIDKTRGPDLPNALGFAAYQKQEEPLRALLELGADPNVEYGEESRKSCAALRAIEARWPKGLEILLAAGASPHGPSGAGPCGLAKSAISKNGGSRAMLDALEYAGANLVAPGVGERLLAAAAWEGCADSVVWLCERGVDPATPIGGNERCALEVAKMEHNKESSALIEAYALSARERRDLAEQVGAWPSAPARRV